MADRTYGKYFFIFCLLVALYFVYRMVQPFLAAVVWAGVFATVFYPLYRWLARKIRRPRLGSVLTCFLLTVVIIVPILFLLVLLADQSVDAYRVVERKAKSGEVEQWESFRQQPSYLWIRKRLDRLGIQEPDLGELVIRAAREISGFLVASSTAVFSRFAQFILHFCIMLLTLYYFLVGGPPLISALRELSPLPAEHEEKVLRKFREVVEATLRGSFLTALLQGCAGGVVFYYFGLPSPLLWGAVMALLSLVPLFGTALVWFPVVIFYAISGAWFKAILLLILCGGIVSSIDNFVKPLLIKGKAQVHTLWIFFGVLGGIGVFGFLGLVLGPLLVALLFTLIEIYKVEFRDLLITKSLS